MKARFLLLATAVITLCALGQRPAAACTGIRILPKDGAVISARTLEFAADLRSDVIVVPRAKDYVGTAPGQQAGLRWKTRYAAVGTNGFDAPAIVEGFNEKGLSIGIFYFPGYGKYQDVSAADLPRAIAPWELPVYLLSTCATVPEALEAARGVRVGATVEQHLGIAPPCHYMVNDAGGHCVVLEYIDGALKVHENPLGVITNSPSFDWHVTNLRNYVNLSVTNVPPVESRASSWRGSARGAACWGCPAISRRHRDLSARWRFRSRPCRWRPPARASCRRFTSSTSSTSRWGPPAAWRTASRWPTIRCGRARRT